MLIWFGVVGALGLLLLLAYIRRQPYDGAGISIKAFIFYIAAMGMILVSYRLYRKAIESRSPDTIIIGGRVTQANQRRWLNDRLVLLYAQDAEAARSETKVNSFRRIIPTPTDGIFLLSISNRYKLKANDLTACKARESDFAIFYCWIGDLSEESPGMAIDVEGKRLHYLLRVIPGDYDVLPEEMKEAGMTGLSDGSIVILPSKPKAPGWLDTLFGRNPSAHADTPNLIKDLRYDPEPEIVDVPSQYATSMLDNCKGSEIVRQTFTDGKTFIHEYVLQASMGAEIPVDTVKLQLGAQGTYRQKQISTKTIKYEIAAKPGTNVSYKIHLQEIWRRGIALVKGKKGLIKVPFRVQTDIKYFIETDAKNCAAL